MEPIVTLGGQPIFVDPATVPAALTGERPEPIQIHWVEAVGTRWPPKQAFELITGIPRRDYTSHEALRALRRLGLPTSSWRSAKNEPQSAAPVTTMADLASTTTSATVVDELRDAVEVLAEFLTSQRLTARLSALEHHLDGADRSVVGAVTHEAELGPAALLAALRVRQSFGRMSDVIHATAIALTLQKIMIEGETLTSRPSLGAGNDPKRQYDVETNLRVAEFKLSVWRGADAMRKRGVAKDLVHLALADPTKKRQLFVVGNRPRKHLEESTSSMAWNLDRASAQQRTKFIAGFKEEALAMPLCEFRRAQAKDVEIIDLIELLPELQVLLELD